MQGPNSESSVATTKKENTTPYTRRHTLCTKLHSSGNVRFNATPLHHGKKKGKKGGGGGEGGRREEGGKEGGKEGSVNTK